MSQIVTYLVSAAAALAGFLIRWRLRGFSSGAVELERIALVILCLGAVGSNYMIMDWPTLLALVIVAAWLAWHLGSGGSALPAWAVVWAFCMSPLFPHKMTQSWGLAVAAWLWWHVGRGRLTPRGRRLLCGGLVPAWAAVVAGWTVAVLLSPSPGCGLEVLAMWSPALLVLFPLSWAVATESRASVGICRSWGLVGGLVTLILVLKLGAGMLRWQDGRLAMGATNANALALSLIAAATGSVVWWIGGGGRVAALCFVWCSAGALLVQPKGALAGVWLGALAAAGQIRFRRISWIVRGGLVLAGLVALAMLFRFHPRPFLDRILLARATLATVAERPWFGWGLGAVQVHLWYGWTCIWRAGVLTWESHNLYLGTAEATGVIGLVLLVVLFASRIARAARWTALPLISVASLGMVDYVLTCVGVMPLVVLALGVAAPLPQSGRKSRAVAAIGVCIVLAAAVWPSVPDLSCTPYPIKMLRQARRLWDEGMVRASLQAYLEAARSDPNEEMTRGVWEEGALRSLKGGARRQGALMFARALLVRPQIVLSDYWPRLGASGPRSRLDLSEALACAERDARLLLSENRVGGAMLLGNLARAYYLARRRGDAERVFLEIRHLLPLPRESDESQPDVDTWMEAWLEKQRELTGRHRF